MTIYAERVIISDADSHFTVGGTRVVIVAGSESQVHEYATGVVTVTDKEVLYEGERLCYCTDVQWGMFFDKDDNQWVNDERTVKEEDE